MMESTNAVLKYVCIHRDHVKNESLGLLIVVDT